MNLRIKFGITAQGKFISHLDLLRAWERAFRRAQVPIQYSQGFNPHPLISFGSALAVGVTSSGEYMDITLKSHMPIEEIKDALTNSLPMAFVVSEIVAIEPKTPALMSVIDRAKYLISFKQQGDIETEKIGSCIDEVLKQEKIFVQRKTKKGIQERDIRGGIFTLEGRNLPDNKIVLIMVVETGSGGNVRPEEVVLELREKGLPLDIETMAIHREGLYVSGDAGLTSPLSIIN